MQAPDLAERIDALTTAWVYDLEQPRYVGAPTFAAHAPGFLYFLHRRHEAGLEEARTSASGMLVTTDHSGTHIDALCHQAFDLELYGGRRVSAAVQSSAGFAELGAETIPPIIARGILLDVARIRGVERLAPGYAVSAEDLEEAAESRGLAPRAGDVVLVRTGNGALWESPEEYIGGAGIGVDGSRWLAAGRPLAVGADNLAWDVIGHVDSELGTLPGHTILIVRNGIYILENLSLEELSLHEENEFLFLCLPLKMRGATGSPVRPLAIVPANSGGEDGLPFVQRQGG